MADEFFAHFCDSHSGAECARDHDQDRTFKHATRNLCSKCKRFEQLVFGVRPGQRHGYERTDHNGDSFGPLLELYSQEYGANNRHGSERWHACLWSECYLHYDQS